MQKDIQAELILCPNCEEEVPKTLYCLNCGYPLYKVEMEGSETFGEAEPTEGVEVELTAEPDVEAEAPISTEIAEAPTESMPEVEEEPTEAPLVEAEPAETVEVAEAIAAEDIDAEAMEAQVPEIEEAYGGTEVEVAAVEEEPIEGVEEAVVEMTEESDEEEAEAVEGIEEPVEEEAPEMPTDYEPDPLITVVMEQLARNISLKIRLVNLLIEDDVKEATFNRLFESYAAQGERWVSRRNEMLERNRFDLEATEKALTEAKMSLEELGIRRAIHDASEEEYQAKAPALKWDIQTLEHELRRMRGENAYLEDLTWVISAEEIQELEEMARKGYETIDDLADAGRVSSKTAAGVKAALEDALNCLRG